MTFKNAKKAVYLAVISSMILTIAGCNDNTTTENTNMNSSQQPSISSEPDKESISSVSSMSEYDINIAKINLGSDISIEGTGVINDNGVIRITSGGTYKFSGTLEDGYIEVNTEDKVKIRLEGANITNKSGCAINIINAKKVKLVAVKETINTLTDSAKYTSTPEAKGTVFSNDTLEIQGNGALTIIGNYSHAVASDDDIIISNGTLNISAVKNGFQAHDNITIDGGNITITDCKNGFNSKGDVIINGGKINISNAEIFIKAILEIELNGGSISIKDCLQDFESEKSVIQNGSVIN